MKNRLLALLTTLALALSVIPSVFAEDTATEDTTTEETVTTVSPYEAVIANTMDASSTAELDGKAGWIKFTAGAKYAIYKNLKFNDTVHKDLVLEVVSSFAMQRSGALEFRIGSASGSLIAVVPPVNTGSYDDKTKPKYVNVMNPAALVGTVDIYVVSKESNTDNLYSFKFIEAQNAFEELLTEGETLTGEKTFEKLSFTGFNSGNAQIAYAVDADAENPTVTFSTGDTVVATQTLDTEAATAKIPMDFTVSNSIADVKVSASEGVTISSLEFYRDAYQKVTASYFDYRRGEPNSSHYGSITMNGWFAAAYENMDFGDGAENIIVDIYDAYTTTTAGGVLSFYKSGYSLEDADGDGQEDNDNLKYGSWMPKNTAVASFDNVSTGGWGKYKLRHTVVSAPELLNGNIDLIASTTNLRYNNILWFQFHKAVNPYTQLLTEETIDSAKEIKSLYFKGNGAQSVTFDYAVAEGAEAATITVYNDTLNGTTNMTAIDTFTLDLEATTKTITLDADNWQGVKDLYFEVSGATVSGIAFKELPLLDPFSNDTVSALYIADTETTASVKAEFKDALAYYNKTYTDIHVDLSTKSEVEYLDFLANIPAADIVFVQAGAKAEAILAELAKLETKPFTVVIGDASYAADYGVEAVSIGAGAFEADATYKTPTALDTENPYKGLIMIDADLKQGVGIQENNINNIHANDYVMFEDVKFDKGISGATIWYAHTVAYPDTVITVRLGSPTGTVIARYTGAEATGDYVTFENFDMTFTSVYGTHDVYVVSNSSSEPKDIAAKNGMFGNLHKITFTADTDIDAVAGLNAINATVSENVDVADNTLIIAEDDIVTYQNVNFGDAEQIYNIDVEVAVSEDADGSLYIKDGDSTIVEYDLSQLEKGTFADVSETSKIALSGSKTLTVSYAGNGACYIKDINFVKPLKWSDTLNTDNYSADLTNVTTENTHFKGMDAKGSVIVWEDVDFTGNESKLLTMKAKVGLADGYDGGYLTVRADSASGQIIARVALEYKTGMNWGIYGDFEAPVIADISGVHDVYVSVDNSPYLETNKAGNVSSITFVENTSDSFVNSYYVNGNYDKNNKVRIRYDFNSAVRFVNADANLKNFVLVTAIYGTDGKLLGIDYNPQTAKDGVNTAATVIDADVIDGVTNYTVKTFLWNTDTLKPIIAEAIINENVQ